MAKEITAQQVFELLPRRKADSHKGSYGKVMCLAGSARFRGAAALAAEGALRAGAGLVTLASVEPVIAGVAARTPECVFLPCRQSAEGGVSAQSGKAVLEKVRGMDVLLFRMEPKLLKRPARKNSIVYTGTHDNDTAEEAYGKFTHNRRIALRRFFHNRGYAERNFHDLLVHFAFDSDANYVIIPLQDILGLKGEGHMNHPGTIGSPNWEWKLKDYKKLTRELEKVKSWLLQAQRSTCREEIK